MAAECESELNMSDVSVEIPQNLNWIWSQKGRKFFHKVLEIVSNPENETAESSAARTLLSKTFQHNEDQHDDPALLFLKEISISFESCFRNVQDIKYVNVKMTKLESSFKTLREKPSITTNWALLLDACGLQSSETTNKILNHVLQHFWTSIVLSESHDLNEEHDFVANLSNSLSSTASSTSSTLHDNEHSVSSMEGKTIQEHAGWVIKRVRDWINAGPEVHKMQISKSNATGIEVHKSYLQSLIERLGKDNLVQPGKYLFMPGCNVLEVFIYLHEIVEKIVKDGLNVCVEKDILKKCIHYLSEDNDLRKMWRTLLGDEDTDMFRAASVLLLQRAAVMFLKSKQQIIREQLQLKANKQSASLRQTVKSRQKPNEPPSQSIVAFRSNPTDASTVLEFLTDVFSKPEPSVVLNKLHGTELTSILQSLGLPGLNGKAKSKQVELLEKHHAAGKGWSIVFPEKVC